MKLVPLIFLSLSVAAVAELSPHLEPSAKQHKQQASALFEERSKEQLKLSERYSMDLEAAERKATEEGDLELVKLLKTELKRLERGPLPENPPNALPRRLHGSRRAYVRAYERLDAAFSKRRDELDSAYLAQLGKLQKEHPDDTTLAGHIASEKERVLAGAWGPITDLRIGLPGSRWLNNNDGTGVRVFGRDGLVDGNGNWKYEIKDRETVVIHWGGDNHMPMKLHADGKTLGDYNGTWTLLPREEDKE